MEKIIDYSSQDEPIENLVDILHPFAEDEENEDQGERRTLNDHIVV